MKARVVVSIFREQETGNRDYQPRGLVTGSSERPHRCGGGQPAPRSLIPGSGRNATDSLVQCNDGKSPSQPPVPNQSSLSMFHIPLRKRSMSWEVTMPTR